jgi:signal transduction histidine kinase
MTVIQNEAEANSADLPETVLRESRVMRRQVDHHLARARAVGRRGAGQSRALVWQALQSVERAVRHLHDNVTIDIAGAKDAMVAVERQDLDELLGNLIENAAKYGGGRVFVTVEKRERQAESVPDFVDILIEDDGPGIPEAERAAIFGRGARLDTNKPGTGLGLAIVRDVSEIYGGSASLEESEDLGGLLVRLSLPAAESAAPEPV